MGAHLHAVPEFETDCTTGRYTHPRVKDARGKRSLEAGGSSNAGKKRAAATLSLQQPLSKVYTVGHTPHEILFIRQNPPCIQTHKLSLSGGCSVGGA